MSPVGSTSRPPRASVARYLTGPPHRLPRRSLPNPQVDCGQCGPLLSVERHTTPGYWAGVGTLWFTSHHLVPSTGSAHLCLALWA